jgi:DNA-binding MarR family transcriptional regulator
MTKPKRNNKIREKAAPTVALDAKACEALRLENQVCFALYSASRFMTQAYQPLLGPLDLTYPQYLALLVLWEEDDLGVSELGRRLMLDSGTLSPLLKKLEAKGWLRRERSVDDERSVRLRLTPAGRELQRRAADVPATMVCRSGWEIARIVKLRRELEELTAALRAATSDPAG